MHDFSANTNTATCRSELSGRTWTLLTEKYLGPASRLLAPGFDLKAMCLSAALSTLIIVGTMLPLIISGDRFLPRSVVEQMIGLVIALMTLLGHEVGHAAAASRYGHKPLQVGITLHRYMFPALFVDIAYRETPSRNEVIGIALAGCVAQLLLAAVLCLLLMAFPSLVGTLSMALLATLGLTFAQLIPCCGSDGAVAISALEGH